MFASRLLPSLGKIGAWATPVEPIRLSNGCRGVFGEGRQPAALCCPARSSILRGQYVRNHQVLTNTPPSGGFEKFQAVGNDQSTIATWLKTAGYRTTLMGKYLNGYPDRNNPTYVPPGWDEWYSPVTGSAYGNYNYRMNENGRLVADGNTPQEHPPAAPALLR